MSFKLLFAVLAICICVVYSGYVRTPALGYAAPAISYAAPVASYAPVSYAAPVAYAAPAVSYAAPAVTYSAPAVSYAAPAVSYAAPAVAYSAPVVVDKTHFSYGYLNPYGNGHVSAARHGPIPSHSYSFRAGTYHK